MKKLTFLYPLILVTPALLLCSCASTFHIEDNQTKPLNPQNYDTETVKRCRMVGAISGGILGSSICFIPGIMTRTVAGLMIWAIGCGTVGAILLGEAVGEACKQMR